LADLGVNSKIRKLMSSDLRADVFIGLEYLIHDYPNVVEFLKNKGTVHYGDRIHKPGWAYSDILIDNKKLIIGSVALWLQ